MVVISKIHRFVRKYFALLRPRSRIYLLSHMRANTSLLGHILGSNPEVEGYYEMQQSYTNNRDLLLSKLKYYSLHPPKPGAKFIFDKLLGNHLLLYPNIVGPKDRIIIMIRSPGPTVRSISALFSERPESGWSNEAGANAYYNQRLEQLIKLSYLFRGKYLFIKAEDIVEIPDQTLGKISDFLELSKPLSKKYKIFPKTGVRSAGDSSDNIKSGEIKPVSNNSPLIPYEVARADEERYLYTLEVLKKNSWNTE